MQEIAQPDAYGKQQEQRQVLYLAEREHTFPDTRECGLYLIVYRETLQQQVQQKQHGYRADGGDQIACEGELLENLNEYNLCRTQIRLKLDESVLYFLRRSIGNHHLIVKGDHRELIDEFFKWL